MPESIKMFENSLREYLVNAQAETYHEALKIQYRYNNLKVYMDPKALRTPHFTVSVNISEATYSITPVEKLSGSLASDDRLVNLWANKPTINGELRKHWMFLTQQIRNVMDDEVDDSEKESDDKLVQGKTGVSTASMLKESRAIEEEKAKIRAKKMQQYEAEERIKKEKRLHYQNNLKNSEQSINSDTSEDSQESQES